MNKYDRDIYSPWADRSSYEEPYMKPKYIHRPRPMTQLSLLPPALSVVALGKDRWEIYRGEECVGYCTSKAAMEACLALASGTCGAPGNNGYGPV